MNPLDEPMSRLEFIYVPAWPTILKYALIGSAVIIFFNIISFLLGVSIAGGSMVGTMGSMIISLLSVIAYVLIMIFSVREYKGRSGGYISFGKAMLMSYMPGLIMAASGLLVSIIYLMFINPTYISDILGGTTGITTALETEGVYQDMMFAYIGMTFIGGCIVGAAVSLIISAVMKKDYPYGSF